MHKCILSKPEKSQLQQYLLWKEGTRLQGKYPLLSDAKLPKLRFVGRNIRRYLSRIHDDYKAITSWYGDYCEYKIASYVKYGNPSAEKIITKEIKGAVEGKILTKNEIGHILENIYNRYVDTPVRSSEKQRRKQRYDHVDYVLTGQRPLSVKQSLTSRQLSREERDIVKKFRDDEKSNLHTQSPSDEADLP